MTITEQAVPERAGAIGVTDDPEGLAAIQRPGCAAAIWRRTPLPSFQSWIDDLAPEHLPSTRTILRSDRVRDAILEVMRASDVPDSAEPRMLADDGAALAHVFAELMRCSYLRLRLDVVSANACRKFHIDAVTARLVCTYRGTGTQYGISEGGAEPRRVFTVPTGAPMVLRGTLWPEHPKSSLLHGSPPIEGTGETRLLLVLDPVEDPSGASQRTVLH